MRYFILQDLLLGLLEKHGSFIKIPLDPWANLHIDGVSYVYVLYKDFPEKTCVPIVSSQRTITLYSISYF